MKLADEVLKMHEVMKGVAGEMTTVDHGHKHEIEVDEQGNGKTVSVLNAAGEIIDGDEHSHQIKNGEVQDSKGEMAHNHEVSPKG